MSQRQAVTKAIATRYRRASPAQTRARSSTSCARPRAGTATTNKIWVLQAQMTNYFLAQQKLISKPRSTDVGLGVPV
jgi:hypothetical protein